MALQAKDLMVGDWVYIKDHPIKSQPQKVKPEHFVRSLVEFEPIPLTKEILEKNGWSEDYNEETDSVSLHFPEDTDFKLEIYVEGKTILWTINCYEYEIIRLSYVHELQHALKLCKIKKQIEL